MRRVPIPGIPLSFLLLASGCASSPELCGDRVVWAPGSERIGLGKNDEIFVCGDPSHDAWKNVPPRQSAGFVRSYLESKGYLDPRIAIDYDAGRVTVDAGKRAEIAIILSEGDPPGWSNGPLEYNIGRALERSTLDQIEGDALGELRAMGYACATVKLEAHPDGRIVLKLEPGELQAFPATTNMGDYPVTDRILARYEPFSPGDPYDVRETILAGRRIESDVASSATYGSACEGGVLKRLERSASFGPRRTWEIGAGASTEEYPLGFIRWRNNRLWSSASKFQAQLFGSNKRQELNLDLRYFYTNDHPRLYARPVFQYTHKNENQFEQYETKVSLYQGRAIDVGRWTLEPEAGLSVSRIRIIEGAVPRTEVILTPEVNLIARNHDFELYRGDPRSGFETTFAYRYLPGSQIAAAGTHRVWAQGTALANYRDYVEPRWVFGARYTFGTLFTTDGSAPNPAHVPDDWFFFGGGDRDLRGFGRNTLPSETTGAGSIATIGLESRWPNLISFPIEPLVFTDFGWLGGGNAKFDADVLIAPGIGARSATPIGTIRATLARGYGSPTDTPHMQFFASFGTEF